MNETLRRFLAVLAGAALAACGQDEGALATQVAARVNGDEITVHQVNGVLARSPGVDAGRAEAHKRQALERLIDQQLARQQALEKKLDRSPRTMLALEAAKSEILARSYLEQLAAAQPRPSAEDVKKYYDEHPALFAERRLYSVEELVVDPAELPAEAVKARAAATKDLAEMAAWLRSANASVAASRGVRAAEQLPLDWLGELRAAKDGEVRVFERLGRLHVVRVAAARPAPVDEATAAPRIEQFLFNRRLQEIAAQQMRHLRETSNIEYLGEFAGAPGPAAAKAEPAAFAPEAAAKPGFDKGIRGLR